MCPCLAVTTPLSPAPVCTFIFTHHLSHLDKQEKSYHLPLALCCSSVKRCCVTSSWWQAAWRCRLTGWSWRPVALTSVPCSQVHTHTHTRTVVCLASYLDVCVLTCAELCVFAGDMSESKAHQVEIREVDGQTLRKLVDYIYTAEIEVTEDNVQVRATSVLD